MNTQNNQQEFRQNLATKEWVIIAPGRTERPKKLEPEAPGKSQETASVPDYDPTCPFCVGNEERTPNEITRMEQHGKWTARVIPNKFPILSVDLCDLLPTREKSGTYLRMHGCGSHELVIEHPRHGELLGTMTTEEVAGVLFLYRERMLALAADPHILMTTIFRNQGAAAGASQRHPHSQIIATRLVPSYIRSLLYEAQRHFDDQGTCVYCDILQHERTQGERAIFENELIFAYSPYAATVPYETCLTPKQHKASFADISDEELQAMAAGLKFILNQFVVQLNNPDYNLSIKTSPSPLKSVPFFHWSIQIFPRIITPGGFEMGSRIPVNTVPPEIAAKRLRGSSL